MGSMMVHEPCETLTSCRSKLSSPNLAQALARASLLSWLAACSSSSQNDNASANDTGGRVNGSGTSTERPSTGTEGPSAAGNNPAGDSLGSVDDAPSSEVPPVTNAIIDADGEAPSAPSASGGNTDSAAPASDAELDDGTSCPGPTNGASSAAAPGELTETITAGGLTRSFIRRVPPVYTGATAVPSALPDLPTCSTLSMCGAGVETTLCTVQNGTHCGSYDSFDIVNIAWEQMSKATLP
jgi:hypothetical protein